MIRKFYLTYREHSIQQLPNTGFFFKHTEHYKTIASTLKKCKNHKRDEIIQSMLFGHRGIKLINTKLHEENPPMFRSQSLPF